MINKLRRWWGNIFCKHLEADFVRNIYGDEINRISLSKVYRSWWKCRRCKKYFPKQSLVNQSYAETQATVKKPEA